MRNHPRLATQTLMALICTVLLGLGAVPALAQSPAEAIADFLAETQGAAGVRASPATGAAKFVRLQPGALPDLPGAAVEARADAFFNRYGKMFGIQAPGQLQRLGVVRSPAMAHVKYQQFHQGVPVFAGVLHASFNRGNRLVAVNGVFVPELAVSTRPGWSAEDAAGVALARVSGADSAASTTLYVFRSGLLQGVPGRNHLVWEVEAVNAARTVREFVYVDAHSGKVVDQITGIQEALSRDVSETSLGNIVWDEGDPDPIPAGWSGGSAQQVTDWQDEIDGARETYNLFGSMTNGAYLSYDGAMAQDAHGQQRPRHQLPQRQLERRLGQLLHQRLRRRRGFPRVGPRLHRVHQQPDLPVAVGRAQRVVLRHLGRDHRPAQRPRHRRAGWPALGRRLLDLQQRLAGQHLPLADGRGRQRLWHRHPRHVEPELRGRSRQGDGQPVPLRHHRLGRRPHQLRRPQPRLRPAGRRRHLQRRHRVGHRLHQGGAHPVGGPEPARPGERLRRRRRRPRHGVRRADRRDALRARHFEPDRYRLGPVDHRRRLRRGGRRHRGGRDAHRADPVQLPAAARSRTRRRCAAATRSTTSTSRTGRAASGPGRRTGAPSPTRQPSAPATGSWWAACPAAGPARRPLARIRSSATARPTSRRA